MKGFVGFLLDYAFRKYSTEDYMAWVMPLLDEGQKKRYLAALEVKSVLPNEKQAKFTNTDD